MSRFCLFCVSIVVIAALSVFPENCSSQNTERNGKPQAGPGDEMIAEYFRRETRRLANSSLANIRSKDDWDKRKGRLRQQLFESLGLRPKPRRSRLKASTTGKREHGEIVVENIVFQSRPGLFVTGNLYLPKEIPTGEKLPAILYVCGHGRVKIDGVSYGNKVHYQHHGIWFARNGYACLLIDSLQLGEIEGIHHGTYRYGRWWWNARGYTPAGVEAWNCIRAIDYLQTRSEVDPDRIGVTGRSGGGAYSFWIAALDPRIKVAAPVAGITSLHNHVVDGTVEGHCDCMFHVNTFRWDFPVIASLIAPRPLLIVNTDKDRIFPLDGVVDVYFKTRRIYELLDAGDNMGIALYEGPHMDTQPLRVSAFHWFERFFKDKELTYEIADTTAPKLFQPSQLKVLKSIPENEKNTRIDETFTPVAVNSNPPSTADQWNQQRDQWMRQLRSRVFRGWPRRNGSLNISEAFQLTAHGMLLRAYDFDSQSPIRLRLYVLQHANSKPEDIQEVRLHVLDQEQWMDFVAVVGVAFPTAFPDHAPGPFESSGFESEMEMLKEDQLHAYVAPRGIGSTAFIDDEKKRVQIRRRFMLLGQTQDGMQTYDIRRAIQALRAVDGGTLEGKPLHVHSTGTMAGNVVYATLFEPKIHALDLHRMPSTHRTGPIYLNVLRFLDLPQAVAMAGERATISLHQTEPSHWNYLSQLSQSLGWPSDRFHIHSTADASTSTGQATVKE